MRRNRAAALAFSIAAVLAAPAAASSCPALGPVAGNMVTQEFSAGGPGLSQKPAWRVSFGFAAGKGLYITGAHFRKAPSEPWMRVLWDARLSDIFVPYHSGLPRYLDLSMGFDLLDATPADAGPCGRILGGKVVNQLSNHELAWKHDGLVRYREELVLWATLDAANYNYIIRYGFRDDGTIALRIAATSANLPGYSHVAHMHSGLWRVDIDLDGHRSDAALWMAHVEPSGGALKAADQMTPFNGGVEGAAVWNPEQFNHVLVRDENRKNAHGHPVSYEFMPVRMGTARHDEAFSKADFWVTRYSPSENNYVNVGTYANGQSISNADVVVWHLSPMHHEPRDEDGFTENGEWNGVALAMWSGLDIRPRNLWDRTPLFPNE